jgi:hypothetical protein
MASSMMLSGCLKFSFLGEFLQSLKRSMNFGILSVPKRAVSGLEMHPKSNDKSLCADDLVRAVPQEPTAFPHKYARVREKTKELAARDREFAARIARARGQRGYAGEKGLLVGGAPGRGGGPQ